MDEDYGESERQTMPNLSSSRKVFSASNSSGKRQRTSDEMGGPVVGMWCLVLCGGVGQEEKE
jgi:hypothetical protein